MLALIQVYVPPLHYIMAVNDLGNNSRGVIPNISVIKNIRDVISKRDVTMEKVLEIIQNETSE